MPLLNSPSSESKYVVLKLVKTVGVLALVMYVVIPVIAKTNPWIQNKIVFLNNLRWPPFIDFADPDFLGLGPTRNFYLTTDHNIKLGLCKYVVLKFVKTVGVLALVMYVVIPVIVKTNPWIQNKIIFLNNLRWPPFIDFADPESLGLGPTRNFYLTTDQNIKLGLWHAIPESMKDSKVPKEHYPDTLKGSKPIILYLHGNSGTRAGWHRVGLYKLLTSMDFHMITVDYRGYGDSSGSPSEDGLVSDALFVYQWIRQHKGDSPLFIWGHSLGTGVTTKLARQVCRNDEAPDGVFLESGFNNILDAATYHPMSKPFRFIPWFNWLFLDTITHNNIHFESDKSIADVTPPLLILHAEDDFIIPYQLGQKLHEAALKTRPETYGPVEFVSFNASHRYGHKLIFMAPELPDIIRKFIKRCLDDEE